MMELKYAIRAIDVLVGDQGSARKKDAWEVIKKELVEGVREAERKFLLSLLQYMPGTGVFPKHSDKVVIMIQEHLASAPTVQEEKFTTLLHPHPDLEYEHGVSETNHRIVDEYDVKSVLAELRYLRAKVAAATSIGGEKEAKEEACLPCQYCKTPVKISDIVIMCDECVSKYNEKRG